MEADECLSTMAAQTRPQDGAVVPCTGCNQMLKSGNKSRTLGCVRSSQNSRWLPCQRRGSLLLLCLAVFLTLPLDTVASVNNEGDIQQILTVVAEEEEAVPPASAKQPVTVQWGLPDTSATLGKLFQYTLPTDAFVGDIASYKVTEAGKTVLPPWLMWDNVLNAMKGIPGDVDVGKQFFIEVTAFGQVDDDMLSHAKDIFSIDVHEDDTPVSTAMPLKDTKPDTIKPIRCQEGSPVTMVTVIVDTDLNSLLTEEKLSLVGGISGHLGLPSDLLRLMPVGNRPLFDSSALVAGPGDVKKPQHPGATLQWAVGCGNVNAAHMPILQQLESTSHDGSMSQSCGKGIIGWHVTNNRPHVPHRMKRQIDIRPTQTVMPTVGPPSRQPVKTMVVDETGEAVTRQVPTMSSPEFPGEIHPTRTSKHPHHHRTKTKGRHSHQKSKHQHSPKHSPTQKPTRTPMPTPTLITIQPTSVVDSMTAVVHPPYMTVTYPSPGISATETALEPSMTPPLPPINTKATAILPTRTYIVPPDTTQPIASTSTKEVVTEPTVEPPVVAPTTSESTAREPTTTTMYPTDDEFNYAPILRNDINRIEVRVGDILNKTIPKDTFYDFEDGNTRNLKLVFMTMDGLSLPHNSWVKFDQMAQVLYGLPLPDHQGRQEYVMAAIDRKGKIARDAFEIIVQARSHETKINHEFSLTFQLEYNEFLVDVGRRLDIARRLADLYGDEDTSNVRVTQIAPGSVVYAWTNTSVPTEHCPTREIATLLSYLVTSNNTLNQTLVDVMKPYRILKAGATPKGSCKKPDFTVTPIMVTSSSHDNDVRKNSVSSDDDVLIDIVLPVLAIVILLLLAACIACIFYRKSRKGFKLSDDDHHTFINKGIPIIFADELEEKPDPPTKPLIMADEKPPLPPPEYPRSGFGSTPSTPRSDHKEPFDTDDDMMSPLYQKPPPFTGSQDRHPRPRTQANTYRNPPPYVPP